MKSRKKRETLRDKMLSKLNFYGDKISNGYGEERVLRRALEKMPNITSGSEIGKKLPRAVRKQGPSSLQEERVSRRALEKMPNITSGSEIGKKLPRAVRKQRPSSLQEERRGKLRGALKRDGTRSPYPRDEYQKRTGKSQVEVDKLWKRKRKEERAARRVRKSDRGLRRQR